MSHRGIVEEYIDAKKVDTRWQWRAGDPGLEAEMLSQILVTLRGEVPDPAQDPKAYAAAKAKADADLTAVTSVASRARLLEGRPAATLQVDDDLERAWRRVGIALDRGGFTVEDRDRKQGLYFVRYVDPKLAGQEEPGFFSRMFGAKRADLSGTRYQVHVAADKASTLVSIRNEQGAPDNSPNAHGIVELIVNELR